MKAKCKTVALLSIAIILALFSVACAPVSEAVLASTPEPTATATTSVTPSSEPAPTPLPVQPENLSHAQKADMIWTRGTYDYYSKPAKIYIFYLDCNGQYRLVWVKKESNPPGNGFDLLDVFNEEIMFHVSIRPEDQAKVTPSEFPKYIDRMNESLSQYSIVAAGKLLDINDLYANNNINLVGTDTPYDVLSPYFSEAPDGFGDWPKEKMLDAFIDVTPAQYILPIWEYVPNAVTPNSYFDPTPTPAPALTLEQKELLLGIGKESSVYKVSNIDVFHYVLGGHNYRCWTVSVSNEEKSKNSNGKYVLDVYDIFTFQYLFSIGLPNNGVDIDGQGFSTTQFFDYLLETNPALKGMHLVLSFGLVTGSRTYKQEYLEYNNNSVLDSFREGFSNSSTEEQRAATSNTMLSVDIQKDIFLDSTPQEEIMPYWVFTPGAQIPEELKGFYSEADYPPAPAE